MNKKARFSVSYFISVLTIFLVVQWLFLAPARNILEITYNSFEAKLAGLDEECKNEKDENKQSKRYNEEIYYDRIELNSLTEGAAISTSSLHHPKLYPRFSDKPNTPPPNFI